jgi:hypothetical protein
MKEKLKSWILNDQIFYGIIVILVAICSFLLGKASMKDIETTKPALQIIEPMTLPANTITSINNNENTTKEKAIYKESKFVASKNGKKYYLANCSGAKRIKPENIVNFSSRESAEAAGYTKAANCPGL